MPLKLVLALLLVVFPSKACDGGLAPASWHIEVTNAGPGDAMVGISAKDVNRRAVVPAGTSLFAISYVPGGSVVISARPAADVLAQMKARRDQIAAKLEAKPIDLAKSIEIYNQLGQVNAEIRAYESEEHASVCTHELKEKEFGMGVAVVATATFDGSRFNLTC